MSLEQEIEALRTVAASFAEDGEELLGIIPAEPHGERVYVCAYGAASGRTWLALDRDGRPVVDRELVRDAVSIAALCELAEESAGGGDVGELRARLVELRVAENPEGIEDAEAAAEALERTLAPAPRVANTTYLDAIGLASARLEQALGGTSGSPFAEAMQVGAGAAQDLAEEVERGYKTSLA